MNERSRIVIDTLGSDKGPDAILDGAKIILEAHPDIDLTLVGDEEVIKSKGLPEDRIKIINAPHTVTNYDNATVAFYNKEAKKPIIYKLKKIIYSLFYFFCILCY